MPENLHYRPGRNGLSQQQLIQAAEGLPKKEPRAPNQFDRGDGVEVRARQMAFLSAYLETGQVVKSAEASNLHHSTYYAWLAADADFAEAVRMVERWRAQELEDRLDDIIDNPAGYDDALKRPSWANLLMFRTKKLLPAYRDSAPTVAIANVNTVVNHLTPEQAEAVARALAGIPEGEPIA